MPVQLIRKVRDRQPLRPAKIDYDNKICSGLVFCVNRADNVDVVSGKTPTYTTTSRTAVPGIHGYAETSTGYLNYGRTKADDIAGPGTIFSISRLISATIGYIVSSGENAFGRGFSYFEDNIAYINNGFIVGLGVNVQRTTDSGANVIGSTLVPEPSCVTWDGANIKFFANKKLVRTVADTTIPTADASRVTRLAERGSASSTVINCATNLVCVWNRALSEQEVVNLLKNPWQIFEPETIPLFWSSNPPQIVYPNGDVAGGAWLPSTGTDLFACVDESAASDADYIYTTVPGAYQEFYFPNCGAVDPSTGGHVRYRIPAGTGTITAILKQGSTTLQTLGTHTLTGSAQDIDITISASVADSDDLRVGFTASA